MSVLQLRWMNYIFSVALTVASVSQFCQGDHGSKYKRVCYYTNWSQYRPGQGKYTPDDINPKLCTHIIYAFAKVVNSELKKVEWNDDKMFKKLQQLKVSNPGLKTLIAVGGWNARSEEFSKMVKTKQNRKKFIKSSISFLRTYGFDGLDLDWEYPTKRGGKPDDKKNLVRLVSAMKRAFARDGYLLTAAVPAGKKNIDDGYNIRRLAANLDFINLMAYDLHGSWDKTTGENSPLYPSSKDSGDRRQLNMNWAANYWAKKGVPKQKLIIGMATYGRSFTLTNPAQNHMGDPARGAGQAGKFTRSAGFLSYYEICQMQESGRGEERWDNEQKVPYYVNGRLWVGYDNMKSITEKVNWLKDNGYGGAMIWALDLDDFKNVCKSSGRPYPLLSVINDLLTSEQVKTTKPTGGTKTTRPSRHTTAPVTTTTQRTTTHNGKEFSCVNRADGFYPDSSSCSHFYRCVDHHPFHYVCPGNLYYNPKLKLCDWQDNVDCKLDFYGY
ncbi:chitinase-3-like protein 1 [Mercenaria mercenaria]|uniref:chitinase-3-like protein 1 n=1 Tax=Mercenaria mercenaria TaxID=6596 RepID=UPI00234EC596|nr:chitinase-3-like protein 1 [Mercenaria mercenaria]